MTPSDASTDTTPIISVRGLVNQFGEQVVHCLLYTSRCV